MLRRAKRSRIKTLWWRLRLRLSGRWLDRYTRCAWCGAPLRTGSVAQTIDSVREHFPICARTRL